MVDSFFVKLQRRSLIVGIHQSHDERTALLTMESAPDGNLLKRYDKFLEGQKIRGDESQGQT